jgi:uncharacterized protein YyaL (SSP411 family)
LIRLNRLSREKSPYLRQHASNPVDWYPWCNEAIAKARAEDKPILLSIGYSACHWCHVMNRESFMDEETAAIINRCYVPIKVDREERPDIDQLYMKAVLAISGVGGWPLIVFLTPSLKPFYGGTYFPPEDRFGLPSFKRLLLSIAEYWEKNRDKIEEASSEVLTYLKEQSKPVEQEPDQQIMQEAMLKLSSVFDPIYGGFGESPKFPNGPILLFVTRYYLKNKSKSALTILTRTLTSMAKGGIFDQLGGGFHRYSTDRFWLVPHFEKMLYDNALLALIYIDAWRITKDPFYRRVAVQTLDWILTEMASPFGGFYSAQDAESEGREGYYYTWTKDEIDRSVGSKVFNLFYGVTEEGNFEGRNILYVAKEIRQVASELGLDEQQVEKELSEARRMLLKEREKRVKPSLDTKILTSWNALVISALSAAYQAFNDEKYFDAAKRCASFIKREMVKSDLLYHSWCDGEANVKGLLEDYAYLTNALIDLYESDFDIEWLEWSCSLAEKAIDFFEDKEEGGFYNSQEENIILRLKDLQDGATPSPYGMMTYALFRLAAMTQNEKFSLTADKALKAVWGNVEEMPEEHTTLISALDYRNTQPVEIIIIGEPERAKHLIEEVYQTPLPKRVLAQSPDGSEHSTIIPLVKGKTLLAGSPAVYVCAKQSCYPPVSSREELRRLLNTL